MNRSVLGPTMCLVQNSPPIDICRKKDKFSGSRSSTNKISARTILNRGSFLMQISSHEPRVKETIFNFVLIDLNTHLCLMGSADIEYLHYGRGCCWTLLDVEREPWVHR